MATVDYLPLHSLSHCPGTPFRERGVYRLLRCREQACDAGGSGRCRRASWATSMTWSSAGSGCGRRARSSRSNPARPAQVVGVHQRAGAEHAEVAMQAAQAAFASWSRTPVEERAALLLRAAEMIRERKFEFCAWLTL